jgi:hypothetical protein
MKFLKQKNIVIVFLVTAAFFWGAQKTSAGVFDSNNDDGTRPCYCSKDSIGSDGGSFTGNTLLKHSGDNIGNLKTAADCGKACYEKGYVSFVFLDRKYSNDETNKALPQNALSNIPDSYKVQPVAKSQSGPQIQDYIVPGTSIAPNDGIVKCGRPGQPMCTLCHLIAGFNVIIQYIMKIAIGVALLALAIGGVMYVISAGESAMMEMAKTTIANAAIGFVIVFAAFLIVNTSMQYLGTIKNAAGEPTLGINITSWGNFDCTTVQR